MEEWVKEIGEPAYNSIKEMVEALQADYDRLKELRGERDGYDDPHCRVGANADSTEEAWELDHPEEAEELKELEYAAGECESYDDALQTIEEDPLSLRIFGERIDGEWEATSYEFLLSTGGPAVRLVGDIGMNGHGSARLEVQDWFKPWEEYHPADEDVLLAYAACFYYE